jgi:4-carboxymuconolactone decarboxylase
MVRAYPRSARKDDQMDVHRDALRRLAMNDEVFIEQVLSIGLNDDHSMLDPTTSAVARLGALIALDAPPVTYQWHTTRALAAGVALDEIVGVLIAVAPIVGIARVVSAAQEVALAIGYDIDADLESVDPLNA